MTYLALLRGINVGGNNKVDMKKLKTTFESAGFINVSTYINTGNIIFDKKTNLTVSQITDTLEKFIKNDFDLQIRVLVREAKNIVEIAKNIPEDWQNNQEMKCDVMFLWKESDKPNILEQLQINPGIDNVFYESGAVIWSVDRANVNKSGLQKLVGTSTYKQMTIRNCNTVRKLAELIKHN